MVTSLPGYCCWRIMSIMSGCVGVGVGVGVEVWVGEGVGLGVLVGSGVFVGDGVAVGVPVVTATGVAAVVDVDSGEASIDVSPPTWLPPQADRVRIVTPNSSHPTTCKKCTDALFITCCIACLSVF